MIQIITRAARRVEDTCGCGIAIRDDAICRKEHIVHGRSIFLLFLVTATTLAGCVSYDRAQGVKNVWRDESLAAPVIGKTTESDIIAALGPPSQVIGLRDQTVFYYLRERRKGDGAILLLYNVVKEDVTYDRAIYFFDKNGTLQDYGYSREKLAEPK